MDIPKEFYTAATLFSLSGSATAVWIITSVIGYLLQPRDTKQIKKWLGLLLSLALALFGASQLAERTQLTWVVAVVNGFLIYLTAVGANAIVGQGDRPGQPFRETGAGGGGASGGFRERWW